MQYLAIIERTSNNFSAYFPDVPKTIEEVKERLNKALKMHIQGLQEDGGPLPEPLSKAEYMEVQTRGA